MDKPLISVIMPVYNRASWIGRAVESVLRQSYPNVELIVVNDGSNDGSSEVLRAFGERIRILEQSHAGPYSARNLALGHVRGSLIAFIDSDDSWYPFRLECQLPLLRRPHVGLVFGDATLVEYRGGGGKRLNHTAFDNVRPARGRAVRHFARGNFIPLSSVLVRKSCLDEVGGFSHAGPLSADYAKWVQIAMRAEVDYVPIPVCEYSLHGGNISGDLVRSLRSRIILFQELLAQSHNASEKKHLHHILFNLDIHLAIALLRQGKGAAAWMANKRGGNPFLQARWILEFVCNQIHVRMRRFILSRSTRAAITQRSAFHPMDIRPTP